MFKKANNTLSSGRRFSWLYPLIVTAIALPVVCVLWLLQEATKGERETLASLVDEAQSRALIDFERIVFETFDERVNKAVLLSKEDRFSAVSLMIEISRSRLADSVFIREEENPRMFINDEKAKELLAQAREFDEYENQEVRFVELLRLIESEESRSLCFRSGRNAALMALMIGFDSLAFEETVPEKAQDALDSVINGSLSIETSLAQFTYFCRKYGQYTKREDSKRVIQSLDMSTEWFNSVNSGNDLKSDRVGLARSGKMIVFFTEELGLLFHEARFVEIVQGLDSRFEIFDSAGAKPEQYADFRSFQVPLDDFSIGLRESLTPESTSRIRVYLLIGAIVLVLSIVSGVATLLLMFRQRDAAQLKNDLVATVTHELKTPVASIRLLVDTMLDPSRSEIVNTREYLGLIEKENKRLGYLIDNFLSFSRMERDKSSFDLRKIDAVLVATTARDVLQDRFKDTVYSLNLEYDDDVPSIWGDPEALATALGNLLENALKYGGENPVVLLQLRRGEKGASFSVSDQGLGIAKGEQQKIFKKFYQGKRMLSNHGGGVGLGLSIVSFIVSKHFGELSVDSKLGVGSCFTITIPYA